MKKSITVKSANTIRHVNQQKTVHKDIPKNVKKKEKGCKYGSGCFYTHSLDHAASKD